MHASPSHPSLAPTDYLVPSERLPRATAAAWMRRILWGTGLLTLLAALAVLLGPLDETVPMTGEIRPAVFAYASALSTGTVKTVTAREGDPVAAGALLATLDDWALLRDLAQLDADLATARAELARAEASARKTAAVPVPGEFLFSAREMEKQRSLLALQKEHLARTEKLVALGSASEVELMSLRMQLLASEASLARFERAAALAAGDYGLSSLAEAEAARATSSARVAALEKRRHGLEAERARLEIRTPIAGVVSATTVLYPGLAVQPGQALFKVSAPGATVLRLRASEDRVNELRPGQLVRFRPRSNPDRLAPYATARISDVSPERQLDPAKTTQSDGAYLIDADQLSAPYPLPAGSAVDAEVVLASAPFFRRWFRQPVSVP